MSRLFVVIVRLGAYGKRRSSRNLELCRAGVSDFCYTCRAFGREGGEEKSELWKWYNMRMKGSAE